MGLPDRVVDPSTDSEPRTADAAKVYLVGGGIASMAAAVFMIRDGDIPGCNITILDELDKIGGSLDGAGSAADGYMLRGGRMLESKYLCTFDLFSRMVILQPGMSPSRIIKTAAAIDAMPPPTRYTRGASAVRGSLSVNGSTTRSGNPIIWFLATLSGDDRRLPQRAAKKL